MTLSCFLPVKKRSVRAPDKNTKPIGSWSLGLTELKIQQLMNTKYFDEIVVSTDDPIVLDYVSHLSSSDSRLRPVERSEELCNDETLLESLILHAGHQCSGDSVLWTHSTSPFTQSKNYNEAVELYFDHQSKGYDSLVSVNSEQKYAQFMGQALNYGGSEFWPKSQNLKPVLLLNSAIFISPRAIYVDQQNRLGQKPYVYESRGIEGLDVDTQIDWEVANCLLSKGNFLDLSL